MIKKFLKKNWPILLILLIAAFLRLYKIAAYTEFLGDQGRDVTIIKDFLKNGNLFFIGPQTSIGNMYLGPYFYYLIAPSLWIVNYSPLGPVIFLVLINIATVYLTYFVAKSWFSKKIALISAFLFAISPVAIKFSTFIWNPNIMAFFTLLFVYLFFTAIKKENYKYFLYATLAFIMMLNSHYLALAILPLAGFYWLIQLGKYIRSKSKHLKPFIIHTLIAFFIFIISLTPQILFDIKHQGQISKPLIEFFTKRETTVNIKAYKAIPKLPALFTQVNTSLLAGKEETVGLIVTIAFIFLLILFTFKKYKDKNKNKEKENYYYILTWYLFGLVALALYKHHIYDHYFAFLFPAVFILIALLINKFKLIGIPLFILITVYSLLANPFRWSPPRQIETNKQIADSIIAKSNQEDFNFSLLAKQNYDPAYKYILDQKGFTPLLLQNKITEQLFVICEPFQMDCNPINNPEWSIAAFGWAKIDSEWEINGIKVFKLIHNIDGQKQE